MARIGAGEAVGGGAGLLPVPEPLVTVVHSVWVEIVAPGGDEPAGLVSSGDDVDPSEGVGCRFRFSTTERPFRLTRSLGGVALPEKR